MKCSVHLKYIHVVSLDLIVETKNGDSIRVIEENYSTNNHITHHHGTEIQRGGCCVGDRGN